MSEQIRKVGFGSVNDTNEELRSKALNGGKFGLNQGGHLIKFEFNPNAGKDGDAADAVDIVFLIGEREYNTRLYDITRVYDKKGNELTDENSEEYITTYNSNMVQLQAVVTHITKSVGVTQDQIDRALATPPTTFADWATIMTSLVPQDFKTKNVDIFLEYQWTISDTADRTYLQLPKNMKGGYFLNPGTTGNWVEENEWVEKNEKGEEKLCKGLRYTLETDKNQVHKFVRNQNYMESNKAIQQIDGQNNEGTSAGEMNSATGQVSPVGKTSTW